VQQKRNYARQRVWRRVEPALYRLVLAIIACSAMGFVVFFVIWAFDGFGARDPDLLSAVAACAAGLLVPAVGGSAAWAAFRSREASRRRIVWQSAVRVTTRTPLWKGSGTETNTSAWIVRVKTKEVAAVHDLVVGVVAEDKKVGALGTLEDEDDSNVTMKESKALGRQFTYQPVHFGEEYVHPHVFPHEVATATHVNAEQKYKEASIALRPRVRVVFSIDGIRFIRMRGTTYFVDEAPRDVYKDVLEVESLIFTGVAPPRRRVPRRRTAR
jgi:hypothetical protein